MKKQKICEETIKSVGATSMKDMGKIMGALKAKHADSLDFSKVSAILKGLLQKMKYPKEYLNEIKLRLKVSQVIGKTVQLKKKEEKNL